MSRRAGASAGNPLSQRSRSGAWLSGLPSWQLLASLVMVIALAVPGGAEADDGLVQLPGRAGCVGGDGCAVAHGLLSPQAVAISRDGRNVYAGSREGITVMARDRLTDRLKQLSGRAGCVSRPAAGCTPMRGLRGSLGVRGLAVSPDGRNVYGATDSAVVVFARERATGELTQLSGPAGCFTDASADGTQAECTQARALSAPWSPALSPDGRYVYVAAGGSKAVAAFARDRATGALTQLPGPLGCVAGMTGAMCSPGRALDGVRALSVSPDGRNLYAAGGDSIAVFARDPTGPLAQLPGESGCVASTSDGPGCLIAPALSGVQSTAVAPHGRTLYAASFGTVPGRVTNAVSRFARDPMTGALGVPSPPQACIGPPAPCAPGRALFGAGSIAVAPAGRRVYVASRGFVEDTSAGPEVRIPGAVAVFASDPESGELTQLPGGDGCVSTRAGPVVDPRNDRRGCRRGARLEGASGITVSSDGEAVYVAASESDAIAILVRPLIAIAPRRAVPGRARVVVRCLATAPRSRCIGRLSLRTVRRFRLGRGRARKARLGSRRFSIPARRHRTVTVCIPRRLRARLKARRVTVDAAATARSRGRHTRTAATKLRLRLR